MIDIKFIEDCDYERSNDFHNQLYGTKRNLKQWEWEFVTNCKDKILFVIAKENNEILGSQALIPIKLIDKEGIFLSAKSEETLVAPSLRGQGIFKRMYDLLFEYAQENNIQVIWGFTPATKSFTDIGFYVPGNTAQLFMPMSYKAITSLLGDRKYSTLKYMLMKAGFAGTQLISSIKFRMNKKKGNMKNIHIDTRITSPSEAGNICEDFVKQWGGVTIYRDADYLQWRIFNNPNIKAILKTVSIDSKIIGWIAYSVGEDYMGYIIDVMVAAPNVETVQVESAIGALLRDAVTSLKRIGVVGVRGWSINNHPFNKMVTKTAQKMGFYLIKKGEPIVIRYSNPIHDNRTQSMCNIDHWYMTRIYTEGVNG